MSDIIALAKRNVKIFLRDKTAVFFSFLSVIILLTLYLLFLKNNYMSDELTAIIGKDQMTFIASTIMMSGVLVINTMTVSLGNLGNIVYDFSTSVIDGFIVAPVKKYKLILGYYVSSFLLTLIFTLLMWFVIVIYIGLNSGVWFSFNKILITSLYLILYTFISTGFMIFIITFVDSVNAFGALSGIFGTVIGFTCGIYMPLSVLPNFIQKVSSLIPFTHMTILLKQVLLTDSFTLIEGSVPVDALNEIKTIYGINKMKVFNLDIPYFWIIFVSGIISLLLLLWATRRISKKIKK